MADYETALRTVTYHNTSEDPNSTLRTVEFIVNDGSLDSVATTRDVQVVNVNDLPNSNNVSTTGNEDANQIWIVLQGGDVDGTITQYRLTSLPANGTLYRDAGMSLLAATGVNYAAAGQQLNLYFRPTPNWNGTTTFQFVAIDNDGGVDPTPATATLFVLPVNDGPAIINNTLTLTEGDTIILGSGNISAGDIDNTPAELTYTVTGVGGGRFTWTGGGATITTFTQADIDAGNVQFEHDGNDGPAGWDLTVSDGPLTDGPYAAIINFNPSNDAPSQDSIVSTTINEGDDLTLDAGTWSDPDGGTLQYYWDVNGNGSYLEMGEPSGDVVTIPWSTLQSLGIIDEGFYTLNVQVNDGNGGFTVGVMYVTINNTPPSANNDSGAGYVTTKTPHSCCRTSSPTTASRPGATR